jgi:hypothetical protein
MPIFMPVIKILVAVLPIFPPLVAISLPIVLPLIAIVESILPVPAADVVARRQAILQVIASLSRRAIGPLARPLTRTRPDVATRPIA